jgi:VanZ family protein
LSTIADRAWTDRFKTFALALLTLYWLCMFVGTHIPKHDLIFSERISDKLLHLTAYTGLTALVLINWWLRAAPRWTHVLAVILCVAAVGMFDEVTQIPVGRQFELLDWAADVGGALLGSAIVGVALAIHRRRGLIPPA